MIERLESYLENRSLLSTNSVKEQEIYDEIYNETIDDIHKNVDKIINYYKKYKYVEIEDEEINKNIIDEFEFCKTYLLKMIVERSFDIHGNYGEKNMYVDKKYKNKLIDNITNDHLIDGDIYKGKL